jgi:hypothetical protein
MKTIILPLIIIVAFLYAIHRLGLVDFDHSAPAAIEQFNQ